MPDTRSPEDFGAARVIRPGHRFGPKPLGSHIHRTAVSGITAFATCPQLHAFGYELNLKAADEKPARKIGTLIHAGLAYRYGALLPVKPEWMVYPDARTALWTIAQGDIEAGTEALRVFDAYQANYPIEQNIWEPVLVEHQFEVVMDVDGTPERYTLRIDLLARDKRDGALVLCDHKSTYKITKNVGISYRTDREMLTALALCRANGYDVQRVIINAMTKERPDPRFGRFDVPLSEAAYNDLGPNTLYWIRRMRDVQVTHPDPRSRPRVYESCLRKYGACDFGPICSDGLHRIAEYTNKW
jgi:hypothetical protein